MVAYKVNDRLSLAAGVSAVYLDAELRSRINQSFLGADDAESKFTGDDWGVGYNLGLTARLTDSLTLGVGYRSEIELTADGKVRYLGVSPLFPFVTEKQLDNSSGEADITLPQQVVVGLAMQVTDGLVVEVGARWEDWESTDELKLVVDRGTQPSPIERDWNATWTYNLGGQYRFSTDLAMNAGYLYGQNAVPGSTFEVLIPDSDAHLFTIGAELAHGPWTVAGAFGYEYHENRRKNNTVADPTRDPLNVNNGGTANGRYESDIYLVGISLGYKF